MGIDLGHLFTKEPCIFQDLSNRVIALDAHNILHQFLSSIRQRDGTPLKDAHGQITSHLSGLFHRTANLVEARIRPIYVFDGEPHPLKAKTLAQRKERKIQAEKDWKEAIEKGDIETARRKAQQTSRITEEIISQSKELLQALGIPFVQAPSEGEAQASYMVKKGDAYAAGSQDFDCLLFAAPILIRNLTSSGKRKLPKKQAYVAVNPEQIHLQSDLKNLDITIRQLIDIAILIGTDFNDGVKGLGPKKSYELIKKHGTLEQALSQSSFPDQPLPSEIAEIRDIFLQPQVIDTYHLEWISTDTKKVFEILCDQHQFSKDRVQPILEKFSMLSTLGRQKNLFDF